MKVYAMTDIGKMRPINEDSFYLPREHEPFCAVADGMGGHNAGEVASAMAIQAFADSMRKSKKVNATAIHEAVLRANTEVFEESRRDPSKCGMGTTFTALVADGRRIHIAHVGDSRAYLIHLGSISRVTQDHTLVEEMVLQGLITEREARVHPKRNLITRALGTSESVEVDLIQLDVRPDEVLLLCSDGLSNYVPEHEMLRVVTGEGDWSEKLKSLIHSALNAGGSDNITAMIATFEEENR